MSSPDRDYPEPSEYDKEVLRQGLAHLSKEERTTFGQLVDTVMRVSKEHGNVLNDAVAEEALSQIPGSRRVLGRASREVAKVEKKTKPPTA